MNEKILRTELSEQELAQALENCAKEPIHLTGAIQPHGVLFVLSDPGMEILQASNNTVKFFGVAASSIIHKPIGELLGNQQAGALKKIITAGKLQPIKSMTLESRCHRTKRRFDAMIHRSGKNLVLEMEPESEGSDTNNVQNFYDRLRHFSSQLRESNALDGIYQTVVDEVRTLTGFDRVKLYRFDEGWNGTVVSESRADYMPSYLNLRFPASDIPEQARKLYSKSYLRMIADIHYEPVPMIPTHDVNSGEMIDLGLAVLRSVSPVHLQYLDNMNVKASMSVSVIQNQKLWGLIACHHNDPKYVPHKVRMLAELVGHVFSSHLSTLEESSRSRKEQQQKLLVSDITAALTPERPLSEALQEHISLFCDVMGADGVAFLIEKEWQLSGSTPNKKTLNIIMRWLEEHHPKSIFSTHKLKEYLDKPESALGKVAGMFAVPIGKNSHQGYILWFRDEVVERVRWAGKPEKKVAMDSAGFRLTPRGSFSLWKDTLRGKAPKWEAQSLYVVEKIVQLLSEKVQQDLQRNREEGLKEQIIENATQMAAIFEAVQEGIVTIDAKGIIQSVNPSVEKILGYSEKETIGQNLKMLMPKPIAKKHDGYLKAYTSSRKKGVIGEMRILMALHKDGHEVPIELVIEEMKVGGKFMFVGTMRDITERKNAESALKESKAFQDLILSNDPDFVFVKDKEFRIVSANPAFLKLYPKNKRDAVIGSTTIESYDKEQADEFLKYDREAFATGSSEVIETIAFPNGKMHTLVTKKVRFENSEGEPFILGISRDVTEREDLIRLLKRSNEELDEFAYIASHDLKEPLRGIHNHANFLKRAASEVLDEDGNRRLNRVMELTQYMETLISDLLYFSRMGRTDIAIQKTNLNNVVKEIIDSTPMLEEQGVKVVLPKKLPTVVCDKVRIGEIFRNLITNAIKYNESTQKKIEIGSKEQKINGKKEQVFYVKDNGIGIDEEFYDEVFRIFKRLHKKTAYGGGTGSGLTFVKKIVDRHGGDVWIESEKGKGTTFYFTLPGKADVMLPNNEKRSAA